MSAATPIPPAPCSRMARAASSRIRVRVSSFCLQRSTMMSAPSPPAYLRRGERPPPTDSAPVGALRIRRSEEHTSELQSLMRISYAVFCLKKKKKHKLSQSQYETMTQHTQLHHH